jgi:hypothetical protein
MPNPKVPRPAQQQLDFDLSKSPSAPAALLIMETNASGEPLTKEQKRFNSLVAKIKAERLKLAANRKFDEELLNRGRALIFPAEHQMLRAKRTVYLKFHQSPFAARLKKKMRKKFEEMMEAEISDLLSLQMFQEDPELEEAYKQYHATGLGFEEAQAADAAKAQKTIEDLVKASGLDLSEEEMMDPIKVMQKTIEKIWGIPNSDPSATSRRPRKPTKAAIAAAEKLKAAEEVMRKSTRRIYLDLVKHFHPDRESDEARRIEKTELMKQITKAYEDNDQLQLLELQLTLLTDRDHAYANFNDTDLKFFNQSLRSQLAELERETRDAHPSNNGNPFGRFLHSANRYSERYMKEHVSEVNDQYSLLVCLTQAIDDEDAFKDYIDDYSPPLPESDDFVDFPF